MKGIKKTLILKKSSIITVCLICVLVVAGYLNFAASGPEIPQSLSVAVDGNENDFEFAEPENYGEAKFVGSNSVITPDSLRFERDRKKSEVISVFKEISESAAATAEQKTAAAENMIKLAADTNKEINMESLLSAKGFINPVSVISSDAVTVFVEKDTLTKSEIAAIRDVIIAETGVTSDKIRINIK